MAENFDISSGNRLIITEAGRCVACGLCLSHCPTYQLAKVETQSPRGRISLIMALASGELAASAGLNDLLQHCLLCRACEKMCPSSVPFSRIMDRGRVLNSQMVETRSLTKIVAGKLIDACFRHPEWLRAGAKFTRLLKPLARINNKRTIIDQQDGRSFVDYLPSVQAHKRWKNNYPADNSKGKVSLFLGCVSRCLDGKTLDDTLFVLNNIGYSVSIPPRQACCGALSLHAGRGEQALNIMQKNIQAFATEEQTPILFTASGCGASLSEYHLSQTDSGFSNRVYEICHFIDSHWPLDIMISSRNMKVLLHTPCSLENGSADPNAPRRLLSKFANINLLDVNTPYSCCGAAGTKMLTAVKVSNQLRDPVLNQISEEKPDLVVTSNFGCALHLAEGLRKTGIDIPVKHPVSLVADLLRKQVV